MTKWEGKTDWERLRREEAAGIEPEKDPDEGEFDWSRAQFTMKGTTDMPIQGDSDMTKEFQHIYKTDSLRAEYFEDKSGKFRSRFVDLSGSKEVDGVICPCENIIFTSVKSHLTPRGAIDEAHFIRSQTRRDAEMTMFGQKNVIKDQLKEIQKQSAKIELLNNEIGGLKKDARFLTLECEEKDAIIIGSRARHDREKKRTEAADKKHRIIGCIFIAYCIVVSAVAAIPYVF